MAGIYRKFLVKSILCGFLILLGCTDKPNPKELIIGTIAGPETALVEMAQRIALTRYGLNVKIIEFNDYNLPNVALQDGTLDANIFQHQPYLDDAIRTHHYTLTAVGKTFLYPMALYSQKWRKVAVLPKNAVIALPNDPSNEERALLLLEKAGLIRLKKSRTASLHDIQYNPQHFAFRELDAAQLPRVLADVDGAVINTNFAIAAGLSLQQQGLFVEPKDSPYANLIVIHEKSTKKAQIQLFIQAFHSPEVVAKAKELFSDGALPAW